MNTIGNDGKNSVRVSLRRLISWVVVAETSVMICSSTASLAAVGANKINCYPGDLALHPSKVFILHVPANILATLSTGYVDCGPAKSCVTTANPNAAGDNDDGNSASIEPPANLSGSSTNWQTPMDIDLDPTPNRYWTKTSIPPYKTNPLLIKIILDNPNYTFFHAVGSSDWSNALLQGDEGNGMFRCYGGPRIEPNGTWSMTVRAFQSTSRFGGLTIGILVPAGAPGSMKFVPVYVDPKVHNDG